MTDIVSKKKRSTMMSGISSKDTKPEMIVRKSLHQAGYRFRLHQRNLPGKPDLVMPKYRLSIFIHGCFWHRHRGCRYAYQPKTRKEFWQNKFKQNIIRDEKNISKLLCGGWRVVVVWECFIREKKHHEIIEALQHAIHGRANYYEYPPVNEENVWSEE